MRVNVRVFDCEHDSIIPVSTIQQTITRVCRRTNNYFVLLLHTSVSSFLLQGLNRQQESTSYTPQSSDWTDAQFGVRLNQAGNYSYIAQQPGGTAWTQTSVARTVGWHELEIQLSAADGLLHFYIDGTQAGMSARSDYTNLGPIMLGTMFEYLLSDWTNAPSVAFADVEVGSDSPVPIPPGDPPPRSRPCGSCGNEEKI